jgi:hypothetical protein
VGIEEVHETWLSVETEELSPPHPPRVETPAYRAAHHQLVVVLDMPCMVCGVRNSTITDASQNPYKASAVETHHYPIERSLVDACDPLRVHEAFPQVVDQASLMQFVDSEANLLVLCSVHHRSPSLGIHHLVSQDWAILPFLKTGYIIASSKQDAKADMAIDTALLAPPTPLDGGIP